MSKISEAFKDTKAFIPFITGGDLSLEITEQLLYAMEEAGADIIEIGIPFSDPIAEGPVIQAANERALAAGCTTDKLFKTVKKARKKVQVPMVFLTYLNPIYTYGKERFMERCRECGIQGVIVPDMPFEEKGELKEACKEYGIEIISLIAPTSNERIMAIAKEAEGYIYCVSSLGVTGVRSQRTCLTVSTVLSCLSILASLPVNALCRSFLAWLPSLLALCCPSFGRRLVLQSRPSLSGLLTRTR